MENYKFDPSKIEPIFSEILQACGQKWMTGCGSYLFDGYKYEYYKGMYEKQDLLFQNAKKSTRALEIGTYMGHSALIMLLANPRIKLTCIDFDDAIIHNVRYTCATSFSSPAIEVLRKHFPESEIDFLNGDSLSILPSLSGKFDFFHIDGTHENDHITSEFNHCRNLNSGEIMKVIFDDVDSCGPLLDRINSEHSVIERITPVSDWTNSYLEIRL